MDCSIIGKKGGVTMKATVDLQEGKIELTDEYGFRVDLLELTAIHIITKSEKPEIKPMKAPVKLIKTGCFVN